MDTLGERRKSYMDAWWNQWNSGNVTQAGAIDPPILFEPSYQQHSYTNLPNPQELSMFPRRTQPTLAIYLALTLTFLLVGSFFFLNTPTPITHAQSQPEALGSLSGKVTNADGEPLPNISVELQYYQSWAYPIVVQTDNSGHYQFNSVQPGNYRLYFTDPTGNYAKQYYPNASFPDDSTVISISGNAVNNIDMILGLSGTLSVTIQTGDDITSTATYVTLYKRSATGGWRIYESMSTDYGINITDTVRYTELPPDNYRLCVRAHSHYQSWSAVKCYDNVLPETIDKLAPDASDILIEAGQERAITIALNDRPQIEGVITGPNDQPLANIPIKLSAQPTIYGGYPIATAYTDQLGYFHFGYIPSGTYMLSFNDQDTYANRNHYLPIFYPNEVAAIRSTPITIDRTSQINLERKLRPAAQITGKVTLPDDVPLAWANVSTYRQLDDGTWSSPEGCNALCPFATYDSATGIYTLTQIFPGRYRLRADYNIPGAYSGISSYYGGNSFEEADDFDITLGQIITDINFVISEEVYDSSITGQVTANGIPQPGIDVGLFPAYFVDGTGYPYVTTKTDAQGNYRLDGLVAGSYLVGFRDPNGVYANVFYSESNSDTGYPSFTYVTISQSVTISNINVALTPGAKISGHVRTPQGLSPGGFLMQINSYPFYSPTYIPPFFDEVTDANGYFEITGLPAGSYYLSATTPPDSGEFPYRNQYFYPMTTQYYEAEMIVVKEGQTVEKKDFYLDGMPETHLPVIHGNSPEIEPTPSIIVVPMPDPNRPTPTATPEFR